MYPYIILKIENYIPHLYLRTSETLETQIEDEDISLLDTVLELGEKLNLSDSNLDSKSQYNYLINLAREHDETYATSNSDIDNTTFFRLKEYLDRFLEENKVEPLYLDVEVSDEIRDQLNREQGADLLASILDYIYTILIAKSVIAASEMGIGVIHLNDETKNSRLQEKMAMELEKIDVELIID